MSFFSSISKAVHQIEHGAKKAAHQAGSVAKGELNIAKKLSNPTDIITKKITQKIGGKKLESERQLAGNVGAGLLLGSIATGAAKVGLKAASKASAKVSASKVAHHASHDGATITDNIPGMKTATKFDAQKLRNAPNDWPSYNSRGAVSATVLGANSATGAGRNSHATEVDDGVVGAIEDFWSGHDGVSDSDSMAAGDIQGPNPDGTPLAAPSMLQNKWLWIIGGAALIWYLAKRK